MDDPTINVLEIYRTCLACPSQWEGKTDDGRFVYIRYRHGRLRVGLGNTVRDAVAADPTFALDYGDPLDGFMTYEELRELLPPSMHLPPVEANADIEDPLLEDAPSPYPFGE